MATMNVSLPDQMKQWVEAQAGTGRYSNASDYVRDLIRRDQERTRVFAEIQALVDEGEASGRANTTWIRSLRLRGSGRLSPVNRWPISHL